MGQNKFLSLETNQGSLWEFRSSGTSGRQGALRPTLNTV